MLAVWKRFVPLTLLSVAVAAGPEELAVPSPPVHVRREAGLTVKCTHAHLTDREPILQQVRDWRKAMTDDLGFPQDAEHTSIELELGFATRDGTLAHWLLADRRGVLGVVRVPSPSRVRRGELFHALTTLRFGMALHLRRRDEAEITTPPRWFVRGLARHADRHRRGDDFEATHALWSRARLDAFTALWSEDHRTEDIPPCVAALMAAWCAQQDDDFWDALCRHLATGGAWNAETIARLTGFGQLSAFESEWDRWLVARSRRIFEPGATPPGVLRRFRAQLLLYPWEFAIPDSRMGLNGLPLETALTLRDVPGMRLALAAKAASLRVAGAGRDASFERMCRQYADALDLAAAGAPLSRIGQAWQQARHLRGTLESRVAAGETLRDRERPD